MCTGVSNASRAMIAILAAASRPLTSSLGSASAYPRRWASASASSNVAPVRAISVRMKLVVPLTIPCTRSIVAPASDSCSTRMTGTTPATAPSKRSWTPCSRAASHSSSPWWESSCLLAVTTCLPARIAASSQVRAGSSPPISSTIRSDSSSSSSNDPPPLRVSTPDRTGRRPVIRAIRSAWRGSSSAKADPTVPCPSSPTRNGLPGGSEALTAPRPGPSGRRRSHGGPRAARCRR